jgi:hypothetical protein
MAWEKKVSQAEAVKAFLVTVDGRVNMEASVEKFRGVAVRTLASKESDEQLISECIGSLFDKWRGASLGLEYVTSQTVEAMKLRVPELGDPGLFSQLRERVSDVLHAQADVAERAAKGDKPATAAITEGRIYGVKKGASGGFFRKSDQAAKPA